MKELQTGEQPQIPPHWKRLWFGSFEVEQIDLNERFLAVSVPQSADIKSDECQPSGLDQFFDKKGKCIDFIVRYPDSVKVSLEKNETRCIVKISGKNGRLLIDNLGLSEPLHNLGGPSVQNNQPDIFATAKFDTFNVGTNNIYGENYLNRVTLGDTFGRITDQATVQTIRSSCLKLQKIATAKHSGKKDYWLPLNDFYEIDVVEDGNNNLLGNTRAYAKDGLGKKIFELEWKIENGVLIVSEKHLPTKRTRILRVPTVLEMDKIATAAFAKPPYLYKTRRETDPELQGLSEDELAELKGIIDVPELAAPWRYLDKLIDVSLTEPRSIPHGSQGDKTEAEDQLA